MVRTIVLVFRSQKIRPEECLATPCPGHSIRCHTFLRAKDEVSVSACFAAIMSELVLICHVKTRLGKPTIIKQFPLTFLIKMHLFLLSSSHSSLPLLDVLFGTSLCRGRMGCSSSISKRHPFRRNKKLHISEVVVYAPATRIPSEVDLIKPLKGILSQNLWERMSALRSQIVLIAEHSAGSALPELQRALLEYLPLLIGLTRKEYFLEQMVKFKWKNLGDDRQETGISSSCYELLSVIHMMAMLVLSEANLMLIPKDFDDEGGRKISEDCKKGAIDLLLKASGYLEYCIHGILAQMPQDIKLSLPRDLQEGVLEAISMQALGQGVEMQLGLAIENQKATLSVKRRLACEQVAYFAQAHYCLAGCVNQAYGKKHILFLKWKYLEAKAAAYYYHGLVLEKGTEPSSQINAVCCLLAAEEILMDSKKSCLSFCLAVPVTRTPPTWGVMKHLHQNIPEAASKKCQMYSYLFEEDKGPLELPDLPDFQLSLKPDDYELPEIDPLWAIEKCEPQVQTLKERLVDKDEDEDEG